MRQMDFKHLSNTVGSLQYKVSLGGCECEFILVKLNQNDMNGIELTLTLSLFQFKLGHPQLQGPSAAVQL